VAMARCVWEIVRGAGFGLQNRKPNRAGSVLVQGAQIQAHTIGWVYGVE
jgi:hypothetical protein